MYIATSDNKDQFKQILSFVNYKEFADPGENEASRKKLTLVQV